MRIKILDKKIGKKTLSIILGIAVLGAAGGYALKKNSENTGQRKIKISIGGYLCDKELSPELYEYQMDVIRRFEEKNRNVEIIPSEWSFDNTTYLSKADGDTLPTVYYVPMTEAHTVMKLGYAADITEEFRKRGYYEYTNDFILESISKDGKIYIIPEKPYDQGIFVNMKLYDEVGLVSSDGTPYQPKDWFETAEIAQKIKKVTGKAGFVLPTEGRPAGWRFTAIAWGFGTVFEEYENGRWTVKFDSPECVAALQFVKDLKWKYDVLPDGAVDAEKYREIIGKGEAAMGMIEENSLQRAIGSYGLQMDSIGLVGMPAGPARRVTMVGGGYQVINKNATKEEMKAALDWIEFSGTSVEMSDDYIKNFEEELRAYKKMGYVIELETTSQWTPATKTEKYRKSAYADNLNIDYNRVKQYNDKTQTELQMEEPIEAQNLYEILGDIVNEVIMNENADPARLVKEAALRFQTECLDYIT